MFKQLLSGLKGLFTRKNRAEVEWLELNQQVVALYQQGDIHLAVAPAEQALDLARSIYPGDHDNLATSINNLGLLYESQGKFSAAEPLYVEALAMWRRLFGDRDHNSLATSINNLAELYKSQGKFSAAEPLYVEALAMRRRLFGDRDHNSLAASINNLAVLYDSQGKYSAAEPLYVEALAMRRRLFGDRDHDNLAASINNLGLLYKSQGKFSAAEPLYVEALAMRRRLFGDRDHNNLAGSINNLALLYESQGKFSAAEPLYVEALEMCRRLFGDRDHDNLAASINNLAGLYESQGKYSAAEPLYVEALGMRRRLFGDRDHNNLAASINNLAALYESQGKFSAAEPLYVEALEMCRRLFGDRDHDNLAASINNLGLLYKSQGKFSAAEPLYVEALEMRRRLFGDRDHDNLAASINNLAVLYIAQKQLDKAFPLFLEAVEVEDNLLRQWFSYSTEANRLGFIEKMQSRLELLVSFVCEYFPADSEKIAQVGISVARRKAFAAQADVELNYLRYSDRYPDLAGDFQNLATAQGQLTHINHTYYHHQAAMDDATREAYHQAKQTLTERIEGLERKLSANVPELRQLQQHVTLPAIFAALPEHSCAVEFYRFDVYNFGAREWQAPQYVAFILAPGETVRMVKLGDAGEIDDLIDNYRDLSRDANLPSFGVRPNVSAQPPKSAPEVEKLPIDLQLSRRLLMPILETIGAEIQQLIFIPDGKLNLLPIGNLLVGQETRLFQKVGFLGGEKVGFLGASLNDRFVCTYLSTLRELLTRTDRLNRPLNPPIAIANPNYDYPSLATAGAAGSSMLSQLGATFTPIPESELLLDRLRTQLASDAQIFTQDRATENVLRTAKSPKSVVIITHGYLLDDNRDRINLIFTLLQCPEGEELALIQTYHHLIDRNFIRLLTAIGDLLDTQSTNGGDFCRSLGEFIHTKFPELVDRESGHSIDPMQSHGLALAGANSWLEGKELPAEIGRGFLLARDVAYLDLLGTEIVFLIACSSGLGDVKTGEGVFGLRRAFAIAGVKQLITSLWDVPTHPTMLLTDKFFEAYHRGVVPSIALQSAQHYVRDISRMELESMPLGKEILDELTRWTIHIPDPNYPLRHPYFWGAWICQGV